jgi:peptide deformylase
MTRKPAMRRILYCGDPILRRPASRVRRIDDEVCSLLDDMAETMVRADGLGLAAPQVGVSNAIVTIRTDPDSDTVLELINPRIVEVEGEQEGAEGCLSLPTLRGIVLRPMRVLVQATDREGEEIEVEGEGLMARCLAHELDHLAGKLYIDLADPDSLCWMRPDEREELGYRTEPVSVEEARAAFNRMRESQKGS